jgi:hypothetical protein
MLLSTLFSTPWICVLPIKWGTNTKQQVKLLLLRWGETMYLWNWASNRPFVHPSDDLWVSMEQQWNDIDRGKLKDSEKNLSQCHSVHHKSHMDWLGCEPGPLQWEAWAMTRPGKIVVLCILLLAFLGSSREEKQFWTAWYQALLNLICS